MLICQWVYKGQRKSFSKDLILISPTGLWHCSDSLINNSSPEPFRKALRKAPIFKPLPPLLA
jgi:hypothetical protein